MADLKLTELSEVTTPDLADLAYIVDDPGGTPLSYKTTLALLLAQVQPSIAEGRLSLVSGNPVYQPLATITPSSTDTGAETVDFSTDHGLVTGTRIIMTATGGGLTIGIHYFIRAIDSNTIAFYTTLANALADSSRVNLTASITASLRPVGIAGTTLYYTPFHGNRISLYNGTTWVLHSFTERSLALSSLTSGRPYDVFLYDNAGTLTLELTSWTDDTTRATALTTQDGVYVKSGATTRRYLGSIYTTGTDSTEDSAWRRYVFNGPLPSRIRARLRRYDLTVANWTLTAAAGTRQAGANADNQVSIMQGLADAATHVQLKVFGRHSNVASHIQIFIALDGTTTTAIERNFANVAYANIAVAGEDNFYPVESHGILPVGQHDITWLESTGNDTATFLGSDVGGHGLIGWFEC